MTIPGLTEFAGRWHLTRRIDDRRAGQVGQFTGVAEFAPDDEGLAYRETGTLHLGAAAFQAERRYLWRAGPGGIAVYFDDGRFFHTIGPRAAHWCDPDEYNVEYDFDGWPRWRAVWSVRGPRKDYTLDSHYTRD